MSSTPTTQTPCQVGKARKGLALCALLSALLAAPALAFTLDDVARQAQALAGKSYQAPKNTLPASLRDLKFDDYHQITFKADKAYWRGQETGFSLQFHHQGMFYDLPVKINEITATSVREIKYSPDFFNYGAAAHDAEAIKNLGFAGFKVLYPVNAREKNDDFFSMLGASYFRAAGKGQVYGISARGLAIDTALPSGEEFPRFREFWIERPQPEHNYVVIFALLDSPRATGAYRFIVQPGQDTVVQVHGKVYLREAVGKLGLAPLTSMYLFGANQPSKTVDYRPAIHDSDGMAIQAGNGEWIWRPLNNPRFLSVSTFMVENPKGFGLLQRGRSFFGYEDLDERYDLRPSAWIEPQGNWGKGKVELVEIPTADETNDNIVVFWSPEQQPKAGKPLEFKYRIRFTRDEARLQGRNLGHVLQTRRSVGEVKQPNLVRQADGTVAFVVDFVGPGLKALSAQAAVTPQISVGENGELVESTVRPNPITQGWRLTLRLRVKNPKQPTEMRAALVKGDKTLTETWSYQLPANE